MRVRLTVLALTVATALGAGVGAAPAGADVAQPAVVSENPVDWTPHVLDGAVTAITVVGHTVIAGGHFTQVREAGSAKTLSRTDIFAFDLDTGKIDTGFAPRLNGAVTALKPGPNGTVFVGGAFTTVDGVARKGLVRLTSTGKTDPGFPTQLAGGTAYDLATAGTWLYVGGTFTTIGGKPVPKLARVDARTGAVDTHFTITIGTPRAGSLRVQKMAVNPQGTRLVINGTFLTVDGRRRPQIAMIDTSGAGSLADWETEAYAPQCNSAFDTYMRGMDFSPDGSWFAVTTTGGPYGTATLCDTVARFETSATGTGITPTWVNWTGGDSLYAVSVTGAAVYVGGHERWLDNPYGHDSAGPGAVSRPGIGAVDPATGKALAWNPTRTRGHGVQALVAWPRGLLVGSDTSQLGHEYHARIGAFPLP